MTGMDEKALRAALEEANSPATVTRTTRATVEAAIRAYLSTLDVPAHPEGVKDAFDEKAHDLIMRTIPILGEVLLESPRFTTRLNDRFFTLRDDMRQWLVDVADATLSHPEPVAQEAVDRLWDRPIMELAMAKAGHSFDVTAKRGKIRETREAYIASNWSHWREDAIAEVAALSGLAHPSPSPEQGEDTGPVTSRLNQISRRSNIWREVAETGDQGNEPLPQALDALDEAVRIARACRRELSTLRSRVAELEARATPQDSDAVRALRKAADYIAPYLLWTISEESPGYHPTMRSAVGAFLTAFDIETQEKRMVRLRATLSNQGGSSNGQ